jgi:hypothetical protein|nr:MAG TPA: hypothetical protein [Caudoviricetes sp.]
MDENYTDFGFSASVTGVSNVDGTTSMGLKYEDSTGVNFDVNVTGADSDAALEKLTFATITKLATEKKKQEEMEKKNKAAEKRNDEILKLVSELDKLDVQRAELNEKIKAMRYAQKENLEVATETDLNKFFDFLK